MIADNDRSMWFGASDTSIICGNWETETFKKWWLEKLGLRANRFRTKAMSAGTHFEHRILQHIGAETKDRQVLIPELCLRVNYDGDTAGKVHEVKTHKTDQFKVSKAYWQQAQVEMFAFPTRELEIVSYRLTDQDYQNYFSPIDPDRLRHHEIEYDESFVMNEYLPRLLELSKCLREGRMPK